MFRRSVAVLSLSLSALSLGGCAVDSDEEFGDDDAEDVATASEALTTPLTAHGKKARRLFRAMIRAGLPGDGAAGSVYVGAAKIRCSETPVTPEGRCKLVPLEGAGSETPIVVKGPKAMAIIDVMQAAGIGAGATPFAATIVRVVCRMSNMDDSASCSMRVRQ